MARLTTEEKRTILQLHYDGKKLKDIIEATGRSREAIVGLFVDCGISEGSVRLEQYIWDLAERMFDKDYREKHGKRPDHFLFRQSTAGVRNYWYKQAREEYMNNAQTYLDSIMLDDEPKPSIVIDKKDEPIDIFDEYNVKSFCDLINTYAQKGQWGFVEREAKNLYIEVIRRNNIGFCSGICKAKKVK